MAQAQAQAQLNVNKQNTAYIPEHITLQGTIQRIVFHNQENGYCVLQMATRDQPYNLTLVGHLAAPREHDEYRFTGTWANHPRFGRQLKFTDAELLLPVGKSGIARYLSNITRGVGAVKAKKIAAALGENALSQIRENPEALNHPDLKFLTNTQKSEIITDLTKNSIQAELAALICGPGIGLGTVYKILNTLGASQETLEKVKENPYMLCDEVFGIGFKLADQIAFKIGIEKDSPFRIDAALNFVLREAAGEGHCYLTPTLIVESLLGTLETEKITGTKLRGRREKKKEGIIAHSGVGVQEIAVANQRLIDQGKCVREGDAVYAKALYVAERLVAKKVKALISEIPRKIEGLESHIRDIESRDSVEYALEQRDAIAKALTQSLSIITGGPGTGKTTVINAICEIYGRLNPTLPIYLAAPTGRAAKRMEEAAGQEAKTIHRLLAYNPNNAFGGNSGFGFNINNPLPGPGLIILDEMSMADIELASSFFAAINVSDFRKMHQVVFVGDVDQLPSVGPGSVLRDLIASNKVPTTHLKYNYRQAGGSKIADYADRVCRGEMLQLKSAGDFEFSPADGGDEAAGTITSLVQSYIQSQGLSPLDWQVLVPMRRGSCGVKELNKVLREIANPTAAGVPVLGVFRVGDKVMVIKNHYGLEVFNGDIGIVKGVKKGKLTVDFGDKEVDFAVEHLELLVLAYASTIHKCVALNTLIETDRGLLRINLANSGRVAAIDGVKAFTRTSMLPRQKMLRITTEDGYRIIATPDHGLDTWGGEEYQRIEARELKIDDWLQIGLNPRLEPAEIPKLPAPISGDVREKVFSVPEKLTEDLAEFFGLMVADGTSFERGFRLAKRHKEVTDRFAELCFNLFGYKAQRCFQNGAYFVEVCSVYLRRWLKNIGGMEPNKKAVPDCILAGNSNHHRAFLRGLFEDASVNIRTSDPDMVDHIDFCTCMEGLAADVQVMLARLGLVSNHVRGVGYNRKHRHSKLYIYGEYARKFGSEIGFISHEKQKRCELKAGCQTRYCIPVTVDEFKEIRRLNESVFTNSDLSNVRTRGHISRNQYKKLKIVPSHLKERFENHHSRIVSIEKFIGESTCLNVPEGHRFLQNAISGWNSQGSEFKLVIMGLCSQHYIMLQRNLLYTGMTRAKERLVLVGDTRSVAMAVKNNRIEERLSRLKERVVGTDGI